MKPRHLRRYERAIRDEIRSHVRRSAPPLTMSADISVVGDRWDIAFRFDDERPNPCMFSEGRWWHSGPLRYNGLTRDGDPAADAREVAQRAQSIFAEALSDPSLVVYRFKERL